MLATELRIHFIRSPLFFKYFLFILKNWHSLKRQLKEIFFLGIFVLFAQNVADDLKINQISNSLKSLKD